MARRQLKAAVAMAFIGQVTASIAFIVYSWLLANWVFVVTNALMLVTAALGQGIYLSNKDRRVDFAPPCDDRHSSKPVLFLAETLNDEL